MTSRRRQRDAREGDQSGRPASRAKQRSKRRAGRPDRSAWMPFPYTSAVSPDPSSITTDPALDGEPIWADNDDLASGEPVAVTQSALAPPRRAIGRAGTRANGGPTVPAELRPPTPRRPRHGLPVRPVPPVPTPDPLPAPAPGGPSVRPSSLDRGQPGPEPHPDPLPGRRATRRGRRVKRIVRHVDLWSVLKLCLVLYVCLYTAVLLAVAGLWAFINSAGLIDRFESFMKDVGFDKFQFHGPQMFRAVAAGGAILVLVGALLTVIAFALFNAVSELTGGLRLTVIEEDVAPPRRRRRRAGAVTQQAASGTSRK